MGPALSTVAIMVLTQISPEPQEFNWGTHHNIERIDPAYLDEHW